MKLMWLWVVLSLVGVNVAWWHIYSDLRERLQAAETAINAKSAVRDVVSHYHPLRVNFSLHQQKEQYFMQVLEDYVAFHRKVTSGLLQPRYAKCEIAHGFGNAWQQLVSCVLYAIVSQRALVVTRRGWDKQNSFLNNFEQFYLPPPVPLFHTGNISMLPVPLYGPADEHEWKNYHRGLDKAAWCHDLHLMHNTEPYVSLQGLHGYDYFASLIQENPHHQLLHRIPSNFYQLIHGFFVKLQPQWQQEIDEFKRNHFGAYTIGIQLRKFDGGGSGTAAIIPVELYLQAAELLASSAPVPFEQVVFFIAAPDNTTAASLQEVYGSKRIVSFSSSVHSGKTLGFLTMWLLGECNDIVTTETSSYGTNAAARTGLTPVVCNHQWYCHRRLTPQPCAGHPYPVERQKCVKNASSTFHRFSSVESHCGYFYRLNEDCLGQGCRDNYNSFPNFKLPPWPVAPASCANSSHTRLPRLKCQHHCTCGFG
eukprot:TRINITY_DN23991_c0_g1_i1.p1 TRINITY_DN23991_c0_g1~~TRINITY_DN23991_c0_g1_i1.p1  ORF type:complete len:479 (+),score=63.09 TRINITY_DN23991_c0_g1_i1:81-1517(+)